MRPLDWLTAGLAVLAIGGLLAQQVAAAWRARRNEASGAVNATARKAVPAAPAKPLAPTGPLSWSRRPAIGRRIAAGGQQLNSPRFSCSPAGGTSSADWQPSIGLPAAPAQPGESWPQPSLN